MLCYVPWSKIIKWIFGGEVILHRDSYLLTEFLLKIFFFSYFSVYFLLFATQSGASLEMIFKYSSYFFNVTEISVCAPNGVSVFSYCCVGDDIWIHRSKIKYCSVTFLIINTNTLLLLLGIHLNVMPWCLSLFLNVSYQNVNYFCLRASVFIKHTDIKLSFFPPSFFKSLLFHCCID